LRAVFACEQLGGFMLADTAQMLALAAREGCVDVLAELTDVRGCACDKRACNAAAAEGRMEALVWLRARRCPWDADTCRAAAQGGYLDMLRYAHEHGCPWNESTCSNAAQQGHLEVLRYAHEHGCPWDEYTLLKSCVHKCTTTIFEDNVNQPAHEHTSPSSQGQPLYGMRPLQRSAVTTLSFYQVAKDW
jgi:hypothetical protein